jgi:uncharacterized membrane protein YgcG
MDNQQSPDSLPASAEEAHTRVPSTDRTPLKRGRFSTRGFTSLLLTLSMLAMCIAGVMLYLTPRGRVANWTDWTLLGLEKEQWASLHMNASLLFMIVAGLHLVLNWSVFFSYLKKKTVAGLHLKKELILASLIATVCIVGTITDLPPFDAVAALNHDIKDYWDQRTARAPVPHAEDLTLAEFATQVNLPVSELTSALGKEGFDAADVRLTVGELGRRKGVAPSAVLAAIQKHHPQAGATTGGGPGPGRGQGFGQGFGQGRGGQSGGGSAQDSQGPDSCSKDAEGCDSQDDSDCSACGAEGPGPGAGPGFGRGQGRGMGMGRGLGRGLGPGKNGEHGKNGTEE